MKKDSLVYKYYYKRSKKIYQSVDKILVTSRMFKQYFIEEFDIPEERIDYLPQYAISEFDNIPKQETKETIDFVFAGNVGTAQNLYVVLKAAMILQDKRVRDGNKPIFFHIIGDGQELDSLKKFASENRIDNVVFHGRKPSSDMPKYYAFADAMIVTLTSDPLIALTLPAKIQSYMAAGKPILASADGEIANVIADAECGFCAKAGDAEKFAEIIRLFLSSNWEKLGENAKKYYNHNFEREVIIEKLEQILQESI